MPELTISDHTRSFAGFTYVYPVLSRRSEGLSLGINLNINNACNWRCMYCQVKGLIRGAPVAINLDRLNYELEYMLAWIINGDFFTQYGGNGLDRFNDIALSGNGEPTLSFQFLDVVEAIEKQRIKFGIDEVKTVLITNGSQTEQRPIQQALSVLNRLNGEVWFKLDRATPDGINLVNQVHMTIAGVKKRLLLSSSLCKTYIQTCMFRIKQLDPSKAEISQYLDFLSQVKDNIAGVLLYSTARKSALAEGEHVSSVSAAFLKDLAKQITDLGILVKYYQ